MSTGMGLTPFVHKQIVRQFLEWSELVLGASSLGERGEWVAGKPGMGWGGGGCSH